MSKRLQLQQREVFNKVRAISNEFRFRILELTETNRMSITELSSALKLSYTKCADYTSILEKAGLVGKVREGKEVFVESKVRFKGNTLMFD